MKLSIITINRNNAEGLRRTIRSVISQTCRDFEYIVIDGASDDGSTDIIREYQADITYWKSEPDKGIYNAMNKGVAQAHGGHCLFMNSGDTLFDRNVIASVLPLLNEKTDFFMGAINLKQNFIDYAPDIITAGYLIHRPLFHQATFIKTELLKKRPYREDIKILADWEQEIYEMLLNNASYTSLPTVIARYDLTGISSTNMELRQQEYNEFILNSLSFRVKSVILGDSFYEKKLFYALTKSPLARDWKILRNTLKQLIKDLLHFK